MPRASNDYILSEVKKREWFFGVRAEESLFFYSAKYLSIGEIVEEEGWPNFIETLLVPIAGDYPIRVFHLDDAKRFHQHSLAAATKEPGLINKYIQKDEALWQKMLGESQPDLESLLKMYAHHGSLFLVIFSLGKVMAENPKKFVPGLLKEHDQWRNDVAFKEEQIGEIFFNILSSIKLNLSIKSTVREMMNYLTAEEVAFAANKTFSAQDLDSVVKQRKKQGYVYACLKDGSRVIDNHEEIKKISAFFKKLAEAEIKNLAADSIAGQAAYDPGQPVRGRVVIIGDKNELNKKADRIAGNILVTIQTTPHFVPYLKDAKAIVTDEGGITCHAAIVSRELKIPCVIGTKIATQVLKDGDEVEVDAAHGKVKIIEKQK